MAQPTFFEQPPSSTLAGIAALTEALLVDASRGGQEIKGLASLDEAGPMHLTFFEINQTEAGSRIAFHAAPRE
jgi:UDP-3-O-[3-hydroxymyristoyl] glucosamine N-acyltransferase